MATLKRGLNGELNMEEEVRNDDFALFIDCSLLSNWQENTGEKWIGFRWLIDAEFMKPKNIFSPFHLIYFAYLIFWCLRFQLSDNESRGFLTIPGSSLIFTTGWNVDSQDFQASFCKLNCSNYEVLRYSLHLSVYLQKCKKSIKLSIQHILHFELIHRS